jgi:hypothetical protein
LQLVLTTGLAYAADSMHVLLVAMVCVCVGIEWNLSDKEVASIVSVMFSGQLAGSFIW